MKHSVLSACLLVLCMALVSEAIQCFDPRPYNGTWVFSIDERKFSSSLVREKCSGLRYSVTTHWRRGHRIEDFCNHIPKWTAIAAFKEDDDGAKYNSHAAIFESCSSRGIWVYHQVDVPDGGHPVRRDLMAYGNETSRHNGHNFYLIEL